MICNDFIDSVSAHASRPASVHGVQLSQCAVAVTVTVAGHVCEQQSHVPHVPSISVHPEYVNVPPVAVNDAVVYVKSHLLAHVGHGCPASFADDISNVTVADVLDVAAITQLVNPVLPYGAPWLLCQLHVVLDPMNVQQIFVA